jgi:archaeosine synthase
MGVDLFDLSRSKEAVARGVILTEDGPREPESTAGEISDLQTQIDAWKRALGATRSAIREGTIRQLAERQALSSPRSVERLRRHDSIMSEKASVDAGSAGLESVVKEGTRLLCHSYTSREDPLIQDWRRRVSQVHTPPNHQSKVLVLLPCSAQKPYRLSQSHRRFQRAIPTRGVNEVMVTAPLGLVPRELEDFWPAAHYDIPVTGDWDVDELLVIREIIREYASRNEFELIINHSGIEIEIPTIKILDTRQGESAGSQNSIDRLQEAIEDASKEYQLPNPKESIHRLEKLKSASRFQHGTDEWLEGAKVSGRPPIFRIEKDGLQIALWNPRSGRFSFSKAVLPILEACNALPRVELISNFDWRGDLFSSNVVKADPNIRSGDEVLVFQEGVLVGSARAEAPSWEWPSGPGRLAKAKHRL